MTTWTPAGIPSSTWSAQAGDDPHLFSDAVFGSKDLFSRALFNSLRIFSFGSMSGVWVRDSAPSTAWAPQ